MQAETLAKMKLFNPHWNCCASISISMMHKISSPLLKFKHRRLTFGTIKQRHNVSCGKNQLQRKVQAITSLQSEMTDAVDLIELGAAEGDNEIVAGPNHIFNLLGLRKATA